MQPIEAQGPTFTARATGQESHKITPTSPFARFDLCRNPFGELTIQQRAELAVVDTDDCLQWLEHAPTAAVQVIGPCGHGKSTHLRALQYAWQARHQAQPLPAFVYFPEEGDQPALPTSRPLFVDEAQRMGWLRRRQLLTRRGSLVIGQLVIGTHRDMSRELTRAGFAVKVIDLDQPMPPERLRELLNRRITASRSAHDHQGKEPKYAELMFTLDQVVALQQRFGSNIRQVEAYLYDHFQCCVLKGEPWLPAK